MKWWSWILLGMTLAGGAALVVWYALRGRSSDARKAAVDMTIAWHKREVDATKAEIRDLMDDFDQNQERIEALTAALAGKREALETRYVEKGLPADEIADRFRRITL